MCDTDRGRRRVEDRDAVALDDRPPAFLVGEIGRALVDHARGGVAERPVDDVAVARDPADVGRAPADVALGLQVEDVVVRRRDADEVARGRVDDSLRLRGRAGRVHQEEEVLRVHRLTRARRRIVGHCQLVEPAYRGRPASAHRRRCGGRRGSADARRRRHRLVGGPLQRDATAPAPGLVLGDEHLAAHVVHPVGERIGREAAEDDGVRRAQPRAGEHHRRQLGDHPEVDGDGRALADTQLLQRVRHADHVAL